MYGQGVDLNILEVSTDEFNNAKQLDNDHTIARLAEKITEILKHDCFNEISNITNNSNEQKYPQQGNNSHRKPYPHPRRQIYSYTSIQLPRTRIIHNKNLDGFRDIMSSLNKLSYANFDTIRSKLLRQCIQKENVTEVINLLIQKVYVHTCYSNMYICLLKEFVSRYEVETYACIGTYINTFIDLLHSRMLTLIDEPIVSDYNEYCAYVKQKTNLNAMYEAAIVLDIEFNHARNKISLIAQFFEFVREHKSSSIIHLVTELVKRYVQLYYVHLTQSEVFIIHSIHQCIHEELEGLPKKVLFGWQDIIHVLHTQHVQINQNNLL
jgi:hypothetical protein